MKGTSRIMRNRDTVFCLIQTNVSGMKANGLKASLEAKAQYTIIVVVKSTMVFLSSS